MRANAYGQPKHNISIKKPVAKVEMVYSPAGKDGFVGSVVPKSSKIKEVRPNTINY